VVRKRVREAMAKGSRAEALSALVPVAGSKKKSTKPSLKGKPSAKSKPCLKLKRSAKLKPSLRLRGKVLDRVRNLLRSKRQVTAIAKSIADKPSESSSAVDPAEPFAPKLKLPPPLDKVRITSELVGPAWYGKDLKPEIMTGLQAHFVEPRLGSLLVPLSYCTDFDESWKAVGRQKGAKNLTRIHMLSKMCFYN